MVSDAQYHRMCMSGAQEQAFDRIREMQNARKRHARRVRWLMFIEAHEIDWLYGFRDNRGGRHPDGKNFAVVKNMTPILREMVSDGTLHYETEFFPRQGIFRHMLRTKEVRPTRARKRRTRNIEV